MVSSKIKKSLKQPQLGLDPEQKGPLLVGERPHRQCLVQSIYGRDSQKQRLTRLSF